LPSDSSRRCAELCAIAGYSLIESSLFPIHGERPRSFLSSPVNCDQAFFLGTAYCWLTRSFNRHSTDRGFVQRILSKVLAIGSAQQQRQLEPSNLAPFGETSERILLIIG